MTRYDPEAKYVYITNNRRCDYILVEGSRHPDFVALVTALKAEWDPDNKKWKIDKTHLNLIKKACKQIYGVTYYSEGGDYHAI
jgi:hypothetical protein